MIDLEAIKQRAGLKRWPTVAELGLIKDDNTALVAEVERLGDDCGGLLAWCLCCCCEACDGQNEAYRQVLTILDAMEGP